MKIAKVLYFDYHPQHLDFGRINQLEFTLEPIQDLVKTIESSYNYTVQ